MKLKDSFNLSVNSILHRRLRSWLTLLGIIIGVAAVVSIISIGEGAQASVSERLSGLGADMITVTAGASRAGAFGGEFRTPGGGNGGGFGEGRSISSSRTSSAPKTPTLTRTDAETIRANPNISAVTEIVSGRGEIVFLAEKANATIEGVNPNTWKETSSLELASGRFLNSGDSAGVVIGDRIANSDFKQPITLGRYVTIEGKSFVVVGILESSGSGMGFGGSDSTAFMTLDGAWEVTDVNKGIYSTIQAKVADIGLVEETTTELTQSLLLSRRVTEETKDFSVTSAQAIKEQVSSATETLTLFLGAIAAVSLLVGAIGVANSMFTSVLEKTREIGILKALGSTNGEILRLFVIESGLFGLVGGIIGVILGTLISLAMGAIGIIQMPMMRGGSSTLVTPQLVIIAIALSTIIGIASGIMPARAAARLKPVEALRYE